MTTLTTIDAASLRAAFAGWADAMERAAPELNELDSRLGDGDLLGRSCNRIPDAVSLGYGDAVDNRPRTPRDPKG
jgi:hypothetical protein